MSARAMNSTTSHVVYLARTLLRKYELWPGALMANSLTGMRDSISRNDKAVPQRRGPPVWLSPMAEFSSPSTASSGASNGTLRTTRILRRPQTIKPNPNATTSGQFQKSFEKMTETIESRLPFRQRDVLYGDIHERQYGEKTEHEMWVEAQEDLQGREKEKQAARQARSYFSGNDLSPQALHVRSPRLKVAQNFQRQQYDKKILKTTAEPITYYYPEMTPEERRQRRRKLIAGWGTFSIATVAGLRELAKYMRTAG